LTPAKEDVLVEQCLRLERWGFPARIHQLRALAEELLRAKGDNMPLGINWPQAFLKRYTCLKSAFITPQDRNRQLSEDFDVIDHWFRLYDEVVKEHNIEPQDIYNIDKRGACLREASIERCIVSKSEKRLKSTHDGSRE
jgi:hypothetical protein